MTIGKMFRKIGSFYFKVKMFILCKITLTIVFRLSAQALATSSANKIGFCYIALSLMVCLFYCLDFGWY